MLNISNILEVICPNLNAMEKSPSFVKHAVEEPFHPRSILDPQLIVLHNINIPLVTIAGLNLHKNPIILSGVQLNKLS